MQHKEQPKVRYFRSMAWSKIGKRRLKYFGL